MKKYITIFVLAAFVVATAGVSFARTLEEEKTAVRNYLKVIDAKINKYRAAGNSVKVKQLQGEKKATLARWNKLKGEMEKAPVPVVTPSPAPIAPAPVAAPAAAGMGMTLGLNVGVSAGLTAVTGVLDYSISGIIPGAKVRVGGDYLTGSNGRDSSLKVVTLKLGGLYALDMLKSSAVPIDWYIGGAVMVPVKVSGGRTGSYGLEAYLGGNYMIPDFGIINAQVGYSALKYGSTTSGAAKGVLATIGYGYSF